MARPRKKANVLTGHWSKAEKINRELEESKLGVNRDGLVAGAKKLKFYNLVAKKEYIRICEEASEIDLLDNMDMAFVKMYADAYGMYEDCMKRMNFGDDFLSDESKQLVVIYEKSIKTIMQCSTKLGLSTTDRLKLIVPKEEAKPANKFLKYVN